MNFKTLAVMGAIIASFMATTVNAVNITLESTNTIVMNKVFTPDVAAQVAAQALAMDAALPAGEPMYLVLNTPGGEIFAGLELIQNLNSLSRPVNTITLFAASMGFQTVQQLKGKRYIVENGTLMSHKAKGGIEGEFPGQLDQRYRYILGVVTDMDRKDAARTEGKHTLESYQALVENEYWCSPKDCATQGFVDAKVTVTCGKSLSGNHEETVEGGNFMGMSLQFQAIFADCPTITAPLGLSATVDGRAYNKVVGKLSRDQKEAIEQIKSQVYFSLINKTKRVIFY